MARKLNENFFGPPFHPQNGHFWSQILNFGSHFRHLLGVSWKKKRVGIHQWVIDFLKMQKNKKWCFFEKSPKMAKIKNIFFFAFFDSLWLPYELSIVLFFKWPPKGAENDRQSSKFSSKNGHFEGEGGVQKIVRSIFM